MVENLTNCRYDGDVVKEFEKANATHVVCNSKVRKYLSLRFIDFYCLQTGVSVGRGSQVVGRGSQVMGRGLLIGRDLH